MLTSLTPAGRRCPTGPGNPVANSYLPPPRTQSAARTPAPAPAADPRLTPARRRLAEQPTSHPPGSPGKLRVMRLRLRLGLPLCHRLDATLAEDLALVPQRGRNGDTRVAALVRVHADGTRTTLDEADPNPEPGRGKRPAELRYAQDPAYRLREAERKRRERGRRKRLRQAG